MEVGKIGSVGVMILLSVAIIAEPMMLEKGSLLLPALENPEPVDKCCRYKCDVNCSNKGFINQACANLCLMHCRPDPWPQCCRYKCIITCAAGGLINQTCLAKCLKINCPPCEINCNPSIGLESHCLAGPDYRSILYDQVVDCVVAVTCNPRKYRALDLNCQGSGGESRLAANGSGKEEVCWSNDTPDDGGVHGCRAIADPPPPISIESSRPRNAQPSVASKCNADGNVGKEVR